MDNKQLKKHRIFLKKSKISTIAFRPPSLNKHHRNSCKIRCRTSPQNSITTFANFNKHPCEYNRSHYGAEQTCTLRQNFPQSGQTFAVFGKAQSFPCWPKFRWKTASLLSRGRKSFAPLAKESLSVHFEYLRTATGKVLENRISH